MNLADNAYASSPVTSYGWRNMTEIDRLLKCKEKINSHLNNESLINFLSANENGYVVVSINQLLGPGERGTLLLDIEEILKINIDNGITIWLEPQSDKSSLRKLRGIEIKK